MNYTLTSVASPKSSSWPNVSRQKQRSFTDWTQFWQVKFLGGWMFQSAWVLFCILCRSAVDSQSQLWSCRKIVWELVASNREGFGDSHSNSNVATRALATFLEVELFCAGASQRAGVYWYTAQLYACPRRVRAAVTRVLWPAPADDDEHWSVFNVCHLDHSWVWSWTKNWPKECH